VTPQSEKDASSQLCRNALCQEGTHQRKQRESIDDLQKYLLVAVISFSNSLQGCSYSWFISQQARGVAQTVMP